jgi:ribosomal protein S18 acetylase RimI-like enzyme
VAATLAVLEPEDLLAVADVLAAACLHDRASVVAEEKLFGACPRSKPSGLVARRGGVVVGVAATCCDRVRLVAVHPAARRQGIGTILLDACEAAIVSSAARRVRMLDEPGNYLAPGVAADNLPTIAWLERRGYVQGEERTNLLVDVGRNPRVTVERARELAARAAAQGYELRRARRSEADSIAAAVSLEFGGAWPFEIERALGFDPPGLHIAFCDGRIAAFAAHDGNNQGLGWFGPAGTRPEHRGRGLGEALLVACLIDIATAHAIAEIAWIGPREFYERTVGTIGARRFVVMTKECGMVAT